MNAQTEIRELLDRLVPDTDGQTRSWSAVVLEANRRNPRWAWPRRFAAGAVAVAAVSALLLAAPWEGGRGGTVLQRALAAVGQGPVVHVVMSESWVGPLVNIRTGEERRLQPEREFWYDPSRGLHEVSRVGGLVQDEAFFPPERAAKYVEAHTVAALAVDYRRALGDGTARVLEKGEIDGMPVYWIRVDTQMLPDVADHRDHEWAHDVGISRETYAPVATRETRDRRVGPDGITRVVKLETLDAGKGDFKPPRPPPSRSGAMTQGFAGELTPAEAATAMGVPGLWAGRQVAGLPLAFIYKWRYAWGYTRRLGRWANEAHGIRLFYGTPEQAAESAEAQAPPFVSLEKPYVMITESPPGALGPDTPMVGRGYAPPSGYLLIQGDRFGLAKLGDVRVMISASSRELLLASARALVPVPEG